MFDHVGLNVKDYLASRAFYERFVGAGPSLGYKMVRYGLTPRGWSDQYHASTF